MKLKLVFLFLLCSLATVQAQTTTPGVVSPTPSSPTGLPPGPTFSSCSYACNSQYLSCVNPCSTAAGIAAGNALYGPERRRASANYRRQHQSVLFKLHKSETNLHARLLWITIRLAEGSVKAVGQR